MPEKLINRKKNGFSIPLKSWLKGPLKSWAEELLDPDQISKQNYLNYIEIKKIWSEHISGKKIILIRFGLY